MKPGYNLKYYEISKVINARDFLSYWHSEISEYSRPMSWLEFEESFLKMISLLNARADFHQMLDNHLLLLTARETFKNCDEILVIDIDALFEKLFPRKFYTCLSVSYYIVELQYRQFLKDATAPVPWLMRPPTTEMEKTYKLGVKCKAKNSEKKGIYIELKNVNQEEVRFFQKSEEEKGGEQRITIGKGEPSMLIIKDPAWQNIQFEIFSEEDRYFLRAYKCQYLSLFKIPKNKKTIVTTKDFILLANTEGFIITKCCGINNIDEKQKKEIMERGSEIIHPKINELPEVMGNSTEPIITIQFVKGELIGQVFTYKTGDQILFGRENRHGYKTIVFQSNLISAQHLLLFYDNKYACWMIMEIEEKPSLNSSYLAISNTSNVNREGEISPDFYIGNTKCEFVTGLTSLSIAQYP